MIRALQRRFVISAMLSLLVLLIIVIGSIILASYTIMERNTDRTLDILSSDTPPPVPSNGEARPMFGYQLGPNPALHMDHCIAHADANGEITSIDVRLHGDYDEAAILDYANRIIENGASEGKISSFKYAVTPVSDGGHKIVFLDMSAQAQILADTVTTACLIGLACLVLMFVILLLVSRRAMQPIASNIEKQRRFVTDAGHEIKTPLAIIQANIDAMELHTGENKWSGHIREQTLRLDGLMKQLLTLAKTDEGNAAITFETVELSKLVSNCVSAFSDMDSEKTIISSIAPNISLQGNPESLEQLVSILLDNAVKYSEASAAITVRLGHVGKKACLEVINTCDALPDAPPQTLFDRFYRSDSARTQKSGGYGIGLSIAKAIVEAHKGRIAAFYDDERTIRFRVEL